MCVYINVCAYILHLLNNGLHKPRRNKSTARSSQHWNFIVAETGHVAGYCGLAPNIWDSPAPIPCRTRRTHRFIPLKSKTDRVGCIHPHSPSFHMFHIPKKMFGQHNDLGYICTWPRFVLVHFHEPIAVVLIPRNGRRSNRIAWWENSCPSLSWAWRTWCAPAECQGPTYHWDDAQVGAPPTGM